ncbi:MAG: GntR family transcriptional regulator [Bacillota bacterium]
MAMKNAALELDKAGMDGSMTTDAIVRPENLMEQVYKALKKRITAGIYPGGYHLVERKLASEFHISKTPVREALARLHREGLVVNVAGKGIIVRELGLDEVKDILEIREVLEGFLARKAAGLLSEEQLAQLRGAVKNGKAAARKGDLMEYKECDIEFHSIIRNAAGNAKACEIMKSLEDQIRLVMTTSVTLPGRFQDSLRCHQEILDALEKGDADLAEARAHEHIRNMRETVVRYYLEKERGNQ